MQCAHEGCFCKARLNDKYCSDYCRQMEEGDQTEAKVTVEEMACECGHRECDVAA